MTEKDPNKLEAGKQQPLDMKHLENVLKKTRRSLQNTYEKGGEVAETKADSARRELIDKSLERARAILRILDDHRLRESTTNELQKAFATLVQNANLLTEGFKQKQKQELEELSDEDLEKMAGDN